MLAKTICFIVGHDHKLVGYIKHYDSNWLTIYYKCKCCKKVEYEYMRKTDMEDLGYEWRFWMELTDKNLNDLLKT